jgi:hypothetical protein
MINGVHPVGGEVPSHGPSPLPPQPAPGWIAAMVLLAGMLAGLARAFAAPGQVYLVLGSDTAVWNAPGGVQVARYREHFAQDLYTQPDQNGFRVMDPAFRAQFADSFGQSLKLTWWMLVGSVYGQTDNQNVPLSNLMPLYLMQKYHRDALRQFGDEVSLHYHTFLWSDYNGDGVYYWNQARTFHECRADFDLALAQSLIEEEVFPVSFRSGWHYMDNEWQNYLNELLLYNMDDDSPLVQPWTGLEPTFNVLDWSQAPTNFVPFHPATTNYQVPGDGLGWNVRSVKFPNVTPAMFDDLFTQAAGGADQVASFWGHLPETDFLTNLVRMDAFAHAAANNHPEVKFRYCTAVEAMQRWRGVTDHTPPQLEVGEAVNQDVVTLTLHTDEPIFQPQPFVAAKSIYRQYQIVPCVATGSNTWTATLPFVRTELAKVGLAVTDPAGNLATRLIRYRPDDLYLDNLDPEYEEIAGNWRTSAEPAWSTDAREAPLAPNETARVRWTLPLTQPGPYSLFVQVPPVSDPADHTAFRIVSGDTEVESVSFDTPLPGNQWVYLGTPTLDPAATNYVDMEIFASDRTNAVARADVLWVSPLALPLPGFIQNLTISPGDSTACIAWTTPRPATSLIEYGPDASLGSFSTTNTQSAQQDVVTLTGLQPGQTYSFQVVSTAAALTYTEEGTFTTATATPTPADEFTPIFGVTHVWKYTTANLDGEPGWKSAGFDDSLWPEGPGLLWVDTRPTGGDPAVQPKNTAMPANPATHFPFLTYYFRTHFVLPALPAGAFLSFSNYINDGAGFYLNGVEVQRNNLPPAPAVLTNGTLATACNCLGDATCPISFHVSGEALSGLVAGDNVLAVEVHNDSADSPDLTFGAILALGQSVPARPQLSFLRTPDGLILYWNGPGFALQHSDGLDAGEAGWSDVPGTANVSPYSVSGAQPGFFRLRSP